ncbi:hypothetical protein KDH_72390 [Dictyobacter sp. S3.2.2.5]|uniref:Uncharacterized protein n=1 Tax=Dictyobacter halimunensis TaxID=3026934 RepID=A0ABQ6G3F8_9CHLR|nr:hypothetical protein KDH_72390 [Dictyobacter sp. S3.2.2.5]
MFSDVFARGGEIGREGRTTGSVIMRGGEIGREGRTYGMGMIVKEEKC